MNLKNITWPDSKTVLKHFIIALIGMAFLIVFFVFADQLISMILNNFYV